MSSRTKLKELKKEVNHLHIQLVEVSTKNITATRYKELDRYLKRQEKTMSAEIYDIFDEYKTKINVQLKKWIEVFMGERKQPLNESKQRNFTEATRKLTDLNGSQLTMAVNQINWDEMEKDLLSTFQNKVPEIFEKSGNVEAAALKSSFNLTNPRAITWLNNHAAEQVVEITERTREGLNSILTNYYEDGKTIGQMSREMRKNIGLHSKWAQAVENKKAKMLKAGVKESIAEARTKKYSKKLLKLRSQNIARTETIGASSAGQQELWFQAGYQNEQKEWIVANDDRLCKHCMAMAGQTVGITEDFHSPTLGISVSNSPLHPQCRCSQRLKFVNKKSKPENTEYDSIDDWIDNLSKEQLTAFRNYTGSYYEHIKDYQRGKVPNSSSVNQSVQDWVTKMNTAFKTAPKYNGKVYRGLKDLPDDVMDALSNSETITFEAFTSTSKKKEIAENFTSYYSNSILFEIEDAKTGIGIEDISSFQGEAEVLFRKGSKFKVQGVEEADDYLVMKLKEVI